MARMAAMGLTWALVGCAENAPRNIDPNGTMAVVAQDHLEIERLKAEIRRLDEHNRFQDHFIGRHDRSLYGGNGQAAEKN